MISLDTLQELYRQMEWADAKIWDAAADAVPEHEPELVDRLYHIHFTQRAFLQVWIGERFEAYDPGARPHLPELRDWAASYYPKVNAFLATVDVNRFPLVIVVPWAKLYVKQLGGPPAATTFGETLFQVWAHTTAHRAQICTRLRQYGVEPPLLDYIGWVWAGKPAPVWTRR